MTDVTRAWPRIAGSGTRAVTVTPTDTELVEACLAGRRDAFDAMVEWHHRAVYRFCVRFVGHHEDARHLVQDVLVRPYRGLLRVKGHASLGTWL